MSKKIFICVPYSSEDQSVINERVRQVSEYFALLMARGDTPFSPVIQGHTIVSVIDEVSGLWNFWEDYCKRLIALSDEVHVLMLPGFKESIGVGGEILEAALTTKPIKYIKPTTYEKFSFNPNRVPVDPAV